MKWLKAKYIYLLIVLSLLVSTGLQVVWLQQLFLAQQKQLKDDIEHVVSRTAQTNMYYSLTSLKDPGNLRQIKQIFLSPQWEQLRLAFDNMKMTGMRTSLMISFNEDSTAVAMNFSLKDKAGPKKSKPTSSGSGLTAAEMKASDSLSLIETKKRVGAELKKLGISSKLYYNLYNHNREITESNVPAGLKPVFSSRKYIYNLLYSHSYQVVLPAINNVVWYRMRYYLASSVLMVVLTCIAFYFILRLLRNQQLYADARADFTSNMTHEFKTPIATVAVALESIKKYNLVNDPQRLQNYLDISQHELHRLDLMVEKVLKISNGEDGEQPLHRELYDVQSGLQQVITSMELQLLNSNASIRFNSSAEPCFVDGDPFHLTNIFYNLIDNAIKYTGNALILEITCACDARAVTLSFRDNGPGIDKLYGKNIFEKFYRIPGKGNTHDTKGSGLGLHYVRQLLERHGGSIKLKSEPGNGADFIITLPAAS